MEAINKTDAMILHAIFLYCEKGDAMQRIFISGMAYDAGKSGLSKYLENVVYELSLKVEIDLILPYDEVDKFPKQRKGVRIIRLNKFFTHPVLNVFWHLFILPVFLWKEGYDWVFMPAGNRRLCAFYPTLSISTIHDLSQYRVRGKYDFFRTLYSKNILPFFMRRVDKIISVSESTANDLVKYLHFTKDDILINPNGYDKKRFFKKENTSELNTRKYILYVSRIEHPGKNHLNLIKAYEKLEQELQNKYDLYLIGSDWNGSEVVHDYVKNSSVKDKIKFLGYIEDTTLTQYYQNASLFVLPSFYEGFGIPLVEAMASGIPVAASNLSSLPEVGGEAVVYFDPYDVNEISLLIAIILNDERLQKKLIQRGLTQVKKFDWREHASQIIKTASSNA